MHTNSRRIELENLTYNFSCKPITVKHVFVWSGEHALLLYTNGELFSGRRTWYQPMKVMFSQNQNSCLMNYSCCMHNIKYNNMQ